MKRGRAVALLLVCAVGGGALYGAVQPPGRQAQPGPGASAALTPAPASVPARPPTPSPPTSAVPVPKPAPIPKSAAVPRPAAQAVSPAPGPPAPSPPGAVPAAPAAKASSGTPNGLEPPSPQGQAAGRWRLTFEDTFDGLALDTARWHTGFGWGSYDSNAWTDACTTPALVSVRDGLLTLATALRAAGTADCAPSGKRYAASAIHSKATFAQEFGMFEARLRMPGRPGMVGAFWLHQVSGASLPEIDIAEVVGQQPRELQMAVHHDDPAIRGNQAIGLRQRTGDLSAGFHTYAVLWQPELITFYFDGQPVGRVDRRLGAGFHRGPAYLILNTMICTSAARAWCQAPVEGPWNSRTALQADWVRVWERADLP